MVTMPGFRLIVVDDGMIFENTCNPLISKKNTTNKN